MKRPMVFLAVVNCMAVCAATAGNIFAAVIALILLTGLLLYMHKAFSLSKVYFLSIMFSIIVFIHTCVSIQVPNIDSIIKKSGIKADIYGKVQSVTQKEEYYQLVLTECTVEVKTEEIKYMKERINTNVLINTSQSVSEGDIVHVSGYVMAFDSTHNEGEFDSRKYYRSIGILYKVRADGLTVISRNTNQLIKAVNQIKTKIKQTYETMLENTDAGIITSIVLGDKSNLDPDIKQLYQKNGIAHLLAISGVHISIIGMGIYKLLRRLGVYFFGSAVVSSVLILAYGLMTGNQVSSLRAISMFIICVTAEVLGRTYDCLSALSCASIMILWQNPYSLENTGFLLSFSAITGISVINPVLNLMYQKYIKGLPEKKDTVVKFFKKYLLKALIMSLSINLATLPVIMSCYYEIPTYSFILNIIVIPLMSLVMISSIIGGITGILSVTAGTFVMGITHFILTFYEKICELVLKLKFSVIICGDPGMKKCLLYYIMLAVTLIIIFVKYSGYKNSSLEISKRHKAVIAVYCNLLLIVSVLMLVFNKNIFKLLPGNIADGELEVCMLDVGQGDSIFVRTPDGKVYLFDSGSTDVNQPGRYRIVPFLKSKGIGSIDGIFISHSDSDHTNAVIEILKDKGSAQDCGINIKNIIMPDIMESDSDKNYKYIVKLAYEKGVTVNYVNAGDIIDTENGFNLNTDKVNITQENNVTIKCIHPAKGYRYESANDYSAVYLIKYRDFSMLMTGDAGERAESAILENEDIKEELKNVDVLKAGHHGSKTSTSEELLNVMNVKAAFISCGVNNTYGHPSKETIKRLDDRKIRQYITAQCRQLSLFTDGKSINIQTWLF